MPDQALLSRRRLVSAAPAALIATTSPVVASPIDGADILVDLVAQLKASQARLDHHDEQFDKACDRYEAPEIPKAVKWRPSDFPGVCIDHSRKCAQYRLDGADVYVYETLDDLCSWWTKPERCANPAAFSKRDRVRVEEIKAGLADWNAAIKHAESVAGLTEPYEASCRESEIRDALRHRIIATPARSAAGMAAKRQALSAVWADDAALISRALHRELQNAHGADLGRLFALSLALDAVGLENTAQSAGRLS